MVLTRKHKSSIRGGMLSGRNFSWKQLTNNMINLICFKSEGKTSEWRHQWANQETRNDFISPENWDNWPWRINWILSLTTLHEASIVMMYLPKGYFCHNFLSHLYLKLDSSKKNLELEFPKNDFYLFGEIETHHYRQCLLFPGHLQNNGICKKEKVRWG